MSHYSNMAEDLADEGKTVEEITAILRKDGCDFFAAEGNAEHAVKMAGMSEADHAAHRAALNAVDRSRRQIEAISRMGD